MSDEDLAKLGTVMTREAQRITLKVDEGIDPAAPVLNALAKGGRVIAPTHPGFGASELPKGMSSIDDLSYFYLDLIEQLDLRDVLLVGVGIGGWLACEIAVKTTERIERLVLGNPLGIKVGDRETRAKRTGHVQDWEDEAAVAGRSHSLPRDLRHFQ